MGSPPPWNADELAMLRQCAEKAATDVDAAELLNLAFGNRRTPNAVYTKALEIGVSVVWTTRPSAGRPAQMRLTPGNDPDDCWAGAAEADAIVREAMLREGRLPQAPSRQPGTAAPRTIGPHRSGSTSSSSGWIV